METKQTALDFLLTELDIAKIISKEKLVIASEVVRQAKEMHKQEIKNAFRNGDSNGTFETINAEQYYKIIFGAQK